MQIAHQNAPNLAFEYSAVSHASKGITQHIKALNQVDHRAQAHFDKASEPSALNTLPQTSKRFIAPLNSTTK